MTVTGRAALPGEAACEMILETDISSSEKSGELSFRQLSNCSELYRITLRFPVDDTEGRLYIETEAYVFCNCRHSFPVSYLLCAVSLCTCSAYSWKLQIQS